MIEILKLFESLNLTLKALLLQCLYNIFSVSLMIVKVSMILFLVDTRKKGRFDFNRFF